MYNILLYFSYSKSVFLKSCKVYFSDIVICISSISWPNFWLGANGYKFVRRKDYMATASSKDL